MIRATHGIVYNYSSCISNKLRTVPYFWECEILQPQTSVSHIRLGWSTNKGELQAPVGYDKWSFAYRDVSGSKVHQSVRDDRYGEPFGPGDIIGCYLLTDDECPENSVIKFFKNGKDQGIAYKGAEIPFGIYYPAVSLYGEAAVRVNFGPTFVLKYDIPGAIPVSELHPMNPANRKAHERLISTIRSTRMVLPTPSEAGVPDARPRIRSSRAEPLCPVKDDVEGIANQNKGSFRAVTLLAALAQHETTAAISTTTKANITPTNYANTNSATASNSA